MRKTTFFKSLLLALALVTGSVSAWGENKTYNLITSTNDLVAGAKYLVVGGNYAMGLQNSSNRAAVSVTIASNSITVEPASATADAKPFEVTLGGSAGSWTLYDAVNSAYLYAGSSSANQLKAQATSTTWTITFSSDAAVLTSAAQSSRNILRFNSSNNPVLFSCYSSGQAAVYLYKEQSASTTAVSTPIITPSGTPKSTNNYWITASVGLSTTTEGASIYYTTNGDAPTASSTAYTAPFDITTTTTVKAIAVKAGLDNSAVAEKTITISTPFTATIPYTEAFNNTLGDWINFEVVGTKPWVASVNGALGNGYGGGDVESWLISPKFTAAGDGIALSFDYASKYVGNPITVKMSSNYMGYGNPSTATWTELSTIAAPTVQDNNYTLKSTGSIIAPGTGTVYFALVYDANGAYSDWRITNAQVKAYVPAAAPTITVTENSVAAMQVVVGNTDAETVTVNGIELTDNIIVSLGGDNANMFAVSPTSLVAADGVASGTVTITYNPTAPGSHTATLKLNTVGGEEVTRALSGTATLATPVATDASGISTTGFTANWNAVPGATEYELSVYTKTVTNTPATDLFISEYLEGTSYNKAIELFNGTGNSVDLSTYSLKKQTNGSGEYKDELTLSGSIMNNDVYVLCYVSGTNSSITSIKDVSDLQTATNTINFNGNDAIALFKDGVKIDEVGVFNQTTSWGADATLIRKGTISSPLATYNSDEWTAQTTDYVADLGSHTYSGQSVSVTPLAGSPFTVVGETSKALSSLTEGTNYYYKVIAKNGTTVTAVSNEIKATTSLDTYIPSLPTGMHLRSVNGNILFNAEANQTVEVYNAIGQKLITRTTTTGLNSIPVKVKGVVFVKLGTEVSKLIVE